MPLSARGEFLDLIEKIPPEDTRWSILEHFKGYFGARSSSSSEGWAYTDLMNALESASENAPLFIEKFFDACQKLKANPNVLFVPDVGMINNVLAKHNLGYEIRPPDLIAREMGGAPVVVEAAPPSVASRARDVLERSLTRSEALLAEGRPREAVQEILWLLETVATVFRGLETQSGRIEGGYFNHIVRDLRSKHSGTTLDRVLEWIANMHGFLSSPTGGGVRHGRDLDRGVELDSNEARLFCNLTRSYISFLLVEHDELTRKD